MSASVPVYSVWNTGPFKGIQFWMMTISMPELMELLAIYARDSRMTLWVNDSNRKQIVVNGAVPGVDINYVYELPSELGAAVVLHLFVEHRKGKPCANP